MEPGRGGTEQAGGRPPAFGRDDAFQHRHEISPRRPQHDGEPAGQRQRHGQRLADRRDLPVAQVGDPRRGGEQDGSLDTPVGLEDHRLGGWRGGRHRLGETVLDQRPAPAFQQAGAQGRTPGRAAPGRSRRARVRARSPIPADRRRCGSSPPAPCARAPARRMPASRTTLMRNGPVIGPPPRPR